MAPLLHLNLHAAGSQTQLGARFLAAVFQNDDGHASLILHRHVGGAPEDGKGRLHRAIDSWKLAGTVQIIDFAGSGEFRNTYIGETQTRDRERIVSSLGTSKRHRPNSLLRLELRIRN